MLNNTTKRSIRDWIKRNEMVGHSTFSYVDLCREFGDRSKTSIGVELHRLEQGGVIQSVHRGFYVTIPVRYQLIGTVPARFYLDDLCRYLKRPYYIGLLSAAEMYGAAHQKSPIEQVVTTLPQMNASKAKNSEVQWVYRAAISDEGLVRKKGENGELVISSPELTAFDLVQYAQYCGGLGNVTSVLAELVESISFEKVTEAMMLSVKGTTIQRLGYVLEQVLNEQEQSEALYCKWRAAFKKVRTIPLNANIPDIAGKPVDKRWKVVVNDVLEVDEL